MDDSRIRLLLLEDNPGDARLVRAALEDCAPGIFAVTTVERLEDALAKLDSVAFDVVLSDLGLPDSTGLQCAKAISARAPALPLVVLTGSQSAELGREAIQLGAQDYLIKGESSGMLIARTLQHAIDRKRLDVALHAANEALEQRVSARTTELRTTIEQLRTAIMGTVQVITKLGELRDPYTAAHERQVADIAVAIGAELGLDAIRLEGLRIAGHLHDIGKMIVPSEILSRPGKLGAIEYELVKEHAQAGFDVLRDVVFPWPVAEVALQHHERIDGSGYPQGLKNGDILFEARIVAVADVVEAMSSHRPYRPALGIETALLEIEQGSGTRYDTQIADACLHLFRDRRYVPARQRPGEGR